jgi:hypothetical protein
MFLIFKSCTNKHSKTTAIHSFWIYMFIIRFCFSCFIHIPIRWLNQCLIQIILKLHGIWCLAYSSSIRWYHHTHKNIHMIKYLLWNKNNCLQMWLIVIVKVIILKVYPKYVKIIKKNKNLLLFFGIH